MRKIFSYLSVLMLFLACRELSAQSKMPVSDAKMDLRFIETVRVKSDTDNVKMGGESRWIEITLSYKLPKLMEGADEKWIDDVEVICELLMPTNYKGRSGVYAHFTGKFTYWSLPCDGKTHSESMYIPPQILSRYKKVGEKIKREMIKEMYAKITFYTKDRRVIGYAFAGPKGKSDSTIDSVFKKVSEPGAMVINVENVIMPRNKTPWAPFNYDYYDLIKEDVQK
ncbi:MAG: hypothetical protein A2020_15705 [Lentisphaerae bacterium GWF2_45_14]|nr:MAG: hypothetical protein A2020_15705 [Lentisphaerae bacterium GWF2_45_14]